MKIFKFFFFAISGFIALYILACVFMPSNFEVSREIEINTNPLIVFNQINDFHNWNNWDPWAEIDSTIINKFDKITEGEGAYREWTAEKLGNGNMKITNSVLLKQIDFEISLSDWSTFYGKFIFQPTKAGVKVNWTDKGNLPFLARGCGPIFDAMIGADFEKGLKNLKDYCENLPASTENMKLVIWESQPYVYILDSCKVSDINVKLGEIYEEIYLTLATQGIMPISQPFAKYINFPHKAGDDNKVILKAGAFLEEEIETLGRIQIGNSTSGNTLQSSHFGVYETVSVTHDLMKKHCNEIGYTINGSAYEIYITDPSLEPNPSKWETKVIYELVN
ncbi:MAG: hypothetical protein CMP66_06220 [Flavobacteriales bacterium]|nr:hypothetical protein [Flavobacteriales bacterium]|tara:strand:+ start:6609 stop:7613 length:1005 start_codon:yes stop_codon:yes gene_type:complete